MIMDGSYIIHVSSCDDIYVLQSGQSVRPLQQWELSGFQNTIKKKFKNNNDVNRFF